MVHLLFSLAALAFAADDGALKSGVAACAQVADGGARLECYDAFARKLLGEAGAQTGAAVSAADLGAWVVTRDVSDFDDSVSYVASVRANEAYRSNIGTYQPELVVRCAEGVLSAELEFQLYLGSGPVAVDMRFGTQESETSLWPVSDRGTSVQRGQEAGQVFDFADKLAANTFLRVRVKPDYAEDVSVSFDISGAKAALSPLRRVCGK